MVELAALPVLSSLLPVDVVDVDELDELVDVGSSVVPVLEVAGGAVVIDVPNEDDATWFGP